MAIFTQPRPTYTNRRHRLPGTCSVIVFMPSYYIHIYIYIYTYTPIASRPRLCLVCIIYEFVWVGGVYIDEFNRQRRTAYCIVRAHTRSRYACNWPLRKKNEKERVEQRYILYNYVRREEDESPYLFGRYGINRLLLPFAYAVHNSRVPNSNTFRQSLSQTYRFFFTRKRFSVYDVARVIH